VRSDPELRTLNPEQQKPMPTLSPSVRSQRIPSGDGGAFATVREMSRLIDHGRKRPDVLKAASQILRGVDWRDRRRVVETLWRFVRDRVDYRRDPRGVELVRSAEVTLSGMAGDCDCQSVLLGSLLASVDAAPLSIVLTRVGSSPKYGHVLIAAQIPGPDGPDGEPGEDEWTPLETIVPGLSMGSLPSGVHSLKMFPLGFTGAGQRAGSEVESRDGLGFSLKKAFKKAKKAVSQAGAPAPNPTEQAVKAVAKPVVQAATQAAAPVIAPVTTLTTATAKAVARAARPALAPAIKAVQDVNKPDDLLSVRSGKIKVNTRLVTALTLAPLAPAAVPAALVLGDKKRIDQLNELSESAVGIPVIPTTIDDHLKRLRAAAGFIPGVGPLAQQAVDIAMGVRDSLNQKPPVVVQPSPSPVPGAADFVDVSKPKPVPVWAWALGAAGAAAVGLAALRRAS